MAKKKWRNCKAVSDAFKDCKFRDNYACRMCGNQTNLTCHHLYAGARHENLRADANNLVTLCESCHVDYHRIFNGVYNHKMITPDTFLVFLRMNEYTFNEEGKSVVNISVRELITDVLNRLDYLNKKAKEGSK